MFCRNCGSDVTDMKFCKQCGTKVEKDVNEDPEKTSDNIIVHMSMICIGTLMILWGMVILNCFVIPYILTDYVYSYDKFGEKCIEGVIHFFVFVGGIVIASYRFFRKKKLSNNDNYVLSRLYIEKGYH